MTNIVKGNRYKDLVFIPVIDSVKGYNRFVLTENVCKRQKQVVLELKQYTSLSNLYVLIPITIVLISSLVLFNKMISIMRFIVNI